MQNQKPPQRVESKKVTGENNEATFIFLHGFGDDADGWINIAQQFHAANKLPHLSWIFPNAPHNHEAMTTAWYAPSSFSPIPIGRSGSSAATQTEDSESDEPAEDAEDEMLASVEYVCGLIDEEVKRGVKLERIVLGGFSQGCAISLVTGLSSRYRGKLGGIVGLSGYLPKGGKVYGGRKSFVKSEGEGGMKVFLGHGTKDMLIPMRLFREARKRVEKTVGEKALEVHEYEGMGHVTSGPEFRDMCAFLEKVVPE